LPEYERILGGRYGIVREISRGGMGVVYLAEDTELDIKVAIKVLPPELGSDPRSVAELRQEAKTAIQLTHPNIMRLHNFASAGEVKFLVMELINGPTLHEVLFHRGKVEPEDGIAVAKQACRGLAYAHKRRVVHRDIKPANIMLDFPEGTTYDPALPLSEQPGYAVKITDFGIARKMRESMTRVSRRVTSGTLFYMSPEQLTGQHMDERSDIYSVGAALYELLCGDPPFHTGGVEFQILSVTPKALVDAPPWLNLVIQKCLSKKAEERYVSCDALLEALEKEEAPEDILPAVPTGATTQGFDAPPAASAGPALTGLVSPPSVGGVAGPAPEPTALGRPPAQPSAPPAGPPPAEAPGAPGMAGPAAVGVPAAAAARRKPSKALIIGAAALVVLGLAAAAGYRVIANDPPEIAELSGPSGVIRATQAAYTWSGADPEGAALTYEYSLDGGDWRAAEGTSVSVSNLSPGRHTFAVRAADAMGKLSQPGEADFAVGLPELRVRSAPEVVIEGMPAVIEVTAVADYPGGSVDRVEYRLGGADWVSASSPDVVKLAGLSPGQVGLVIRAVDADGFVSSEVALGLTVASNSPPTVEPRVASLQVEEGRRATLAFAASDPDGGAVSVEYRIDDKPYLTAAAGATSVDLPLLGVGRRTVYLRAADHMSLSPEAAVSVEVLPAVRLTRESFAAIEGDAARVEWEPLPPDSSFTGVEYRLGGGAWSSVPGGRDYVEIAGLSAGSHAVELRAVTADGAPSAVRKTVVSVGDNLPPEISSLSFAGMQVRSDGRVPSRPLRVSWGASDPEGQAIAFTWWLDGGPARETSGDSADLGVLPAGGHTLRLRAADSGGTWSEHELAFIVDGPPSLSLSTDTTSPLRGGAISWMAADELPGVAFSYDFGDGTHAGTTVEPTVSLAGLAEGAHTLKVTARDALGQASDPLVVSFRLVPNTAPRLLEVPDALAFPEGASATADFRAVADDRGAVGKVEYSIDGGDWRAVTIEEGLPSLDLSIEVSDLPRGEHSLTLRVTDDVGAASAEVSIPVTVRESEGPLPPAIAGPEGEVYDDAVLLGVSSRGAVSYRWSVKGGAAHETTQSEIAVPLSEVGEYVIEVRAVDAAGVVSEPALRRVVKLDNMAEVPGGSITVARTGHRKWSKDVPAFRIDRHEVTVGDYSKFCLATSRAVPEVLSDPRFAGADRPAIGVSYFDAVAYAEWVGKRLPTEAEWLVAAYGGLMRAFPWGEDVVESAGNFGCTGSQPTKYGGAVRVLAGDPDDSDGFAYTSPVGAFPEGATPEGVLDMTGNVWEWVDEPYVSFAVGETTRRAVLGGGYNTSAEDTAFPSARIGQLCEEGSEYTGFRCVR